MYYGALETLAYSGAPKFRFLKKIFLVKKSVWDKRKWALILPGYEVAPCLNAFSQLKYTTDNDNFYNKRLTLYQVSLFMKKPTPIKI